MKKLRRVENNKNGKHVYEPVASINQDENDTQQFIEARPNAPNNFYKPKFQNRKIKTDYEQFGITPADLKEFEEERKAEVAQLKALSYKEYLQTDHWKRIKSRALFQARRRCMLCYSGGLLNVHHRTYDRIGEELQSDVIALCEDCHGRFHDKLPKPSDGVAIEKHNDIVKPVFLNEEALPGLAKYLKRAHDEFIKAGFTDDQAFCIVSSYKWA